MDNGLNSLIKSKVFNKGLWLKNNNASTE